MTADGLLRRRTGPHDARQRAHGLAAAARECRTVGGPGLGEDAEIPTGTGIGGDLKYFEGLPLSAVQDASCRATFADYLANGVPTGLLTVAERDSYHLFLLMRTLMDAVAIKGRLQLLDIDASGKSDPTTELTHRQDGVEGYKKRAREIAAEMQKASNAG